jgi:hypothetical protein
MLVNLEGALPDHHGVLGLLGVWLSDCRLRLGLVLNNILGRLHRARIVRRHFAFEKEESVARERPHKGKTGQKPGLEGASPQPYTCHRILRLISGALRWRALALPQIPGSIGPMQHTPERHLRNDRCAGGTFGCDL